MGQHMTKKNIQEQFSVEKDWREADNIDENKLSHFRFT